MQVASHIGRKDFDGAIRILQGALCNDSRDVPYLEMIDLCHHWSDRNDMAISAAQRALAYDSKCFGAIRLLSKIHAERNEHDTAVQLVRLGMENYPEPLPAAPKPFIWILHLLAVIFPSVRRIESAVRRDFSDPNSDDKEWYVWAQRYLAWYDSSCEKQQARRFIDETAL